MDHSRFGNLPPELRDYIYDLALHFPNNEVLLKHVNDHDMFTPPQQTNCGNCLNLLLTCRQVHDEGVKRLYATNTFLSNQTSPDPSGAAAFEDFIDQIGPNNADDLQAIQFSYTLTHGTLGNGEFRPTLKRVKRIAQRVPSCAVKVCFTFLDIYKSIAIRVRLNMQCDFSDDGDGWVEIFEPSAPEFGEVDESIRFLRRHLNEWKQDLAMM
jgi:hypothetical protein